MTVYQPPMPMNGMDAFMQGMQQSQAMWDSFMNNKLRPYQVELLKAQAQEAQGKALAQQMGARFLQGLTSPGGSQQEEPLTGTQTPGGFDTSGNQVNYNTATTPITQTNNAPATPISQNNDVYAPTQMPPAAQAQVANTNQQIAAQQTENIPANLGQVKVIHPGDPKLYGYDKAAEQGIEINVGGVKLNPKAEETTENGYTTKRWPSGKVTVERAVGETPTEKGQREVGEKKQEAENAAHAAATQEFEKENVKNYQAGQIAKNDINALKETISAPNYKNLAGSLEGYALNAQPMGIPLGAVLAKVAPGKFKPEDLDLLGQANTHMGNVVLHVGQQFKGPFKQLINGLITQMKPNVNDPYEVQQGKVRALEVANELGQRQTELYDKHLKDGMSPIQAMAATDKELPYSKIKQEVETAAKPSKEEYEYKEINGVLHRRRKA